MLNSHRGCGIELKFKMFKIGKEQFLLQHSGADRELVGPWANNT